MQSHRLSFFFICLSLFLFWPWIIVLLSQGFPLAISGLKFRDFWLFIPACFLWNDRKKILVDIPISFWFLLGWIGIDFFLGNAPLSAKMMSIRQIFSPFLLWFLARNIIKQEEFGRVRTFFLQIGRWLLLFGILLWFFPVWKWLDLSFFIHEKHLSLNDEGIIEYFYEPIFGGMPRMMSLLLDPINLGHFLVVLLVLDWKYKELGWWGRIAYFMGICFTFCKGAVLQMVFALIAWMKWIPKWIKFVIIGGMVITLVFGGAVHPGIRAHLQGLWNSFQSITLFGHGLGMAGNIVGKTTHIDLLHIGDTFLGLIIGQLGIVGCLFWVWALSIMYRKCKMDFLLQCLFAGQLLVCIFSETAYYTTSMVLLLVLMGARSERENPELSTNPSFLSSEDI